MDKKFTGMEEDELKVALGDYYSVYVEFVCEKNANEKAQMKTLQDKSMNIKRLNDRLKKQISETRNRGAKQFNKALKDDLDRELEKVAQTQKVTFKLLLIKYQEVKDQLKQAEDDLKKGGYELNEEKSKNIALQERLKKCIEDYEVVAVTVAGMKKDLHASEERCCWLMEENQHLRDSLAAKTDTEVELEALQVKRRSATNTLETLSTPGEHHDKSRLDADDAPGSFDERANTGSVKFKKSQQNDRKFDAAMTENEELKQKLQILEAENERLKEHLNKCQDKRLERKSWIKNPFKNKTMK